MKTITVAGSEALKKLDELRALWKRGDEYPFLIGTQAELDELRDSCEAPTDGGADIIAQAMQFDVEAWLKEKSPKGGTTWPKQVIPKQTSLHSLYEVLSNQRKAEVHLGLVPLNEPHELFAKLGFGGWNDCPDPHIHVALHRYWAAKYGSAPVAVSSDIVECLIQKPPTDKKSALELARQQFSYCYDIVEQGVGTISKLGSSLLGASIWYFWWD